MDREIAVEREGNCRIGESNAILITLSNNNTNNVNLSMIITIVTLIVTAKSTAT